MHSLQSGFSSCVATLPLAGVDGQIADWFHQRMTPTFADLLWLLSSPGSEIWIASSVILAIVILAWKRHWRGLALFFLAVPCGALLCEGLKLLVARPRPFPVGPFGEWGGYSFPSGHATGATALYGVLLLLLLPAIENRRWRTVLMLSSAAVIVGVGFSRVALGAHYLTDVLGGFTLGGAWVALCAMLVSALQRKGPLEETISTNP